MAETVRIHSTTPATDARETDERSPHLPYSLPLELTVCDSTTIEQLCRYPEGPARDEFALNALRIGVLALTHVRGEVDVERIRREGERLLEGLEVQLKQHSGHVNDLLAVSLRQYFDPEDGQFHERVQRLVKQDGELEQLLRRQIGHEDSALVKTLANHFGDQSPLMKLLSPDQSKGLLAALRLTLDEQLASQREHVLSQFSLDNKEGALARFITELTSRQGELSEKLNDKLDDVVQQFSLDDDNSALSRLVKNVEYAQRKITSEFSLDEENSALARLKRELLELLEKDRKASRDFQDEVKSTLQAMVVRKEESDRSTRHGGVFQDTFFEFIQREAQKLGDVATDCGNTTGLIRGCKTGDCVIELGPECAAPGARIIIEAKEDRSYNLKQALNEIDEARKNRGAQIGLFVFSKKSCPAGIDSLARYGDDIVVIWDAEDATTDLIPRTAYTLARALCVKSRAHAVAEKADFEEIEKAILEIEKQNKRLEKMSTMSTTIRNNGDTLLEEIRIMRNVLTKQAERLREKTDELKDILSAEG